MKRLELYLETSIFGFLVGTRQDPYTEATEHLFQEIAAGRFDALISDEVLRELRKAPDPLRGQFFQIISTHGLHEIEVNQE